LKHEVDFIQLEIHYDDMYVDGKTLEQITEILNANDYCLEGKVKHGFGRFQKTWCSEEIIVFNRQDATLAKKIPNWKATQLRSLGNSWRTLCLGS
jgi:hypothetical protein